MTMAEREVVKLPEDQLQNPAVAERRVQQAGFGSATQNSADETLRVLCSLLAFTRPTLWYRYLRCLSVSLCPRFLR